MASISANGSKGHHKFTLDVTETSYSIDNNTSDISFTFKISAITAGYDWSGWGSSISYKVTINGTDYTDTIPSYNGSSTVTLKSGTQTITHDSDGSKTINISFRVTDGAGKSYTPGNASKSGTMTLTTIPLHSIRIKVNGTWKTGTPYVNVNGTWKKGTAYIKVNGVWKKGI